jgi:hypothetical protein
MVGMIGAIAGIGAYLNKTNTVEEPQEGTAKVGEKCDIAAAADPVLYCVKGHECKVEECLVDGCVKGTEGKCQKKAVTPEVIPPVVKTSTVKPDAPSQVVTPVTQKPDIKQNVDSNPVDTPAAPGTGTAPGDTKPAEEPTKESTKKPLDTEKPIVSKKPTDTTTDGGFLVQPAPPVDADAKKCTCVGKGDKKSEKWIGLPATGKDCKQPGEKCMTCYKGFDASKLKENECSCTETDTIKLDQKEGTCGGVVDPQQKLDMESGASALTLVGFTLCILAMF